MPSSSAICSPAKHQAQPAPAPIPEAVYYVVLTVGYNTEYKSDLTSERMTYEKAKLQYDRIVGSLFCDQTGNFYGVALMQIDNPTAIEVEIL